MTRERLQSGALMQDGELGVEFLQTIPREQRTGFAPARFAFSSARELAGLSPEIDIDVHVFTSMLDLANQVSVLTAVHNNHPSSLEIIRDNTDLILAILADYHILEHVLSDYHAATPDTQEKAAFKQHSLERLVALTAQSKYTQDHERPETSIALADPNEYSTVGAWRSAISEKFSGFFHDLKQPVVAVHGFLQLIERRKEKKQPMSPAYQDIINSEFQRLAAILDLAPAYLDKFPKEPLSLEVLHALANIIATTAQEHVDEVDIQPLPKELEGEIVAWSLGAEAGVVSNIISNLPKAFAAREKLQPERQDESKRFSVRFEKFERNDQGWMRLIAHNNGAPIDEEIELRGFTGLSGFAKVLGEEQVSGVQKNEGKGLAFHATVIEYQYGGRLRGQRTDDTGTDIIVELPLDTKIAVVLQAF